VLHPRGDGRVHPSSGARERLQGEPRGVKARLLRWAPLVASAAALVWHSLQYGFVTDDAFISFVYSRNLAEHGALVFNLGMAPVEGYTNFLWTFLIGLLMVVGLPPEVTSLVLGTGFAIATLVVVFRLSAHLFEGESWWDHLAPALLALSAGYACWSSGGLETQMFAFWVMLALHYYATGDAEPRRLRRVGWALALAAMTRPEGVLVAAVLGVHRLAVMIARERRCLPTRDELLCVVYFAALWAPWFAWRWWYYGWPFPNTYYVKAAGPTVGNYDALLHAAGVHYVGQFLRQSGLLVAAPLALVGLLAARPRGRRFAFGSAAALLAAVYLVYTARVGGDFMGLHRFVMPLFPIGALAVVAGLRVLVGLVPAGARRALAPAAALALLAGHATAQVRLTRESVRWGNFASDGGIDTPAYLRAYAHDRALIGRHMRPCMRPDDFVIYGGAGAKPYYLETRGIDVFGLVSERVAHEVPRSRPRAGHNKWAPDRLLLEHEPTFNFSCYSIHANPRKPRWNCQPASWRRHGFEPVTLHVPGLLEQGEYYSFLVRTDRAFTCPGLVR
jgi:arabinofuranosyltransferase